MFNLLAEIEVLKRIKSLPKKESDNIIKRLNMLKENPFPDGVDKKEIKGTSKSVFRLKVGKFRFFYVINSESGIVKITEFLTAEQAHRKYGRM